MPLPRRFRPLVEIAPPWRSREAPPAFTPAAGEPRGRVALLTGCVQSVVFGDVNAATARVLAADGWEVAVPQQGCCGALSAHAGRTAEAERLTEQLRRDLAGFDAIAVNASGCGSHLKDHGLPAYDVSELLAERPRARRHPLATRVAYQDSCHLRHAQALPAAYRASLSRIPALDVVEPAEQDVCCGSAGIYNLVQPAAARDLGERKARVRPRNRRAGARERQSGLPRPARNGAAPGWSSPPGAAPGRARRRVDPEHRHRAPAHTRAAVEA